MVTDLLRDAQVRGHVWSVTVHGECVCIHGLEDEAREIRVGRLCIRERMYIAVEVHVCHRIDSGERISGKS